MRSMDGTSSSGPEPVRPESDFAMPAGSPQNTPSEARRGPAQPSEALGRGSGPGGQEAAQRRLESDGREGPATPAAGPAAAEAPPQGGEAAPLDLILEYKVRQEVEGQWGQRLRRYERAKQRSLEMADWIEAHFTGPDVDGDDWNEGLGCLVEDIPERGKKLQRCGSWLWFREALEGREQGRRFLYAADFCQQFRLCQFCAIRRASKTVEAYGPKVVTELLNGPDRRALFVTLTQESGPDLQEAFDRLTDGLSRFNHRWRKRGRDAGHLRPIAGGVGSIEVKRGSGSGQWHPHYHGVWLTDGFCDFGALRRTWAECVRQEDASCDFRELNAAKAFRTGCLKTPLVPALQSDLVEVFKYAVKFGEMSFADTWHAFETLHGVRMVRSFGCMRGVTVFEGLIDQNAPNWQAVRFADLFFRYVDGGYRETPDLRE